MKKITKFIHSVFCFFGIHSYKERSWFFSHVEIKGKECRYCGSSPTWDR